MAAVGALLRVQAFSVHVPRRSFHLPTSGSLIKFSVLRTRRPPEREKTVQFGLASRRLYSQEVPPVGPNRHSPTPTPAQKPKPTAPVTPHTSQPHTRHEVHEGTSAVNLPMNPPGGGGGSGPGGSSIFPITNNPLLDAALTTIVGLAMVFVGGVAYIRWYKKNVLDKIEEAFAKGYDPALELAKQQHKKPLAQEEGSEQSWTHNLRRREQKKIDKIVHGEEPGHYFVLLGPKGSGKGTMIFDSMATIQADGVSMCDAHPDLEVFRLRLGKALNYEFNEDSQTGLFQRRDPREGGPALDIERALNKLEKVALRSTRKTGRPLVLVINNVHFFNNDEGGRNMLLQLQSRAEQWAASGILTMVFSSDDFWPFQVLRKNASRMHVLSITDLNNAEARNALHRLRNSHRNSSSPPEEIEKAISIVGGRLAYLNKVSRHKDMVGMAEHILAVEKGWLCSQIGLIPDCDDDVMDEQKWSSCSWLLLREFVKIRKEQETERQAALEAGTLSPDEDIGLKLPSIPYWRCRQIMTRADFLEDLDRANIISIDINHNVRPDSMLILRSAQEVVSEEGFDDILDGVRARIDEIESLHRTRELTFKDVERGDRIQFSVDKGGAALLETLLGPPT